MRDPTKAGGKASSAWTDINEIMAHGWQIEDEERGERSAEQPDYIRSLVTPSRDGVHLVFRHDTAKSKTSTAPDGSGVTANYPVSIALPSEFFAKSAPYSQLMHCMTIPSGQTRAGS